MPSLPGAVTTPLQAAANAVGNATSAVGEAVVPHVPPPPPAIGVTRNPIVNIATGAVVGVGSNALVSRQVGEDANQVAFGINLAFQFIKQFPFINQNLWWPVILAALGIGIFWVGTQGDVFASIKAGGSAAFQAALNYHSLRMAGINLLPPASEGRLVSGTAITGARAATTAAALRSEIVSRLDALRSR